MKRAIPWIIATVVLTVLFHVLTIKAYPYYVMIKLKTSQADRAINTIHHSPRITAESRTVVRPSPDLIYSVCGFDLTETPLRITAPAPAGTYWSVSMFGPNTDNFFVINDRQLDKKEVDIILVKEGTKLAARGDAMVVRSPSPVGVVLFRMLITGEDMVDNLIKTQKQASCRPLE